MSEIRILELGSWKDFQAIVTQADLAGWAFRGQEDADWPLECSISRILRGYHIHQSVWAFQEERINRIFRRKAHLFLQHIPADEDDFQWLALMQHHGAPTRLLDFTWSPYVSAFFALEKAKRPAAIWAICAPRIWTHAHADPESGSALSTADLSLKTAGNYQRWYLNGALPFVFQGDPFVMNQRLIAQSGTFVVPGVIDRPVEKIISEYEHADRLLMKLVVPPRARTEFLTHLYSMNITNATLFPGLDGLARSLSWELEYHWEFDTRTLAVNPSFRPEKPV